jgi:hypothetical protein
MPWFVPQDQYWAAVLAISLDGNSWPLLGTPLSDFMD